MQPFYIDIDRQNRLVTMVGVSFDELAPYFPILPDNLLFLGGYSDHAVFDPFLCAFYAEGDDAHAVFRSAAPPNLAFIDYKKNARRFVSEKEITRFVKSADQFVMPGNPFSVTLDNQYLYLSRDNQIKLYFKNIDRFMPMLGRLLLNRFFDTDITSPPDGAVLHQLQALCTNGVLFKKGKGNNCHLTMAGHLSKEQIDFLMASGDMGLSPRYQLIFSKTGRWKIQTK